MPPRWGCGSLLFNVFRNETYVRYNKRARKPRPYEDFLMRITHDRCNINLLKSQRDDRFIEARLVKKTKPQRGDI